MKKVGEITHEKSGISVPFFLDGITFRCTTIETAFSAPDAKILEAKVKDHIEHWLTLEWHPVIVIDAARNDGWGSSKKTGLWLTMDRMYLSKSPAGTVLYCDWDADPSHRKAVARIAGERELRLATLPLGAPLKISLSKTWMDYTEAKWEALKAINEGIDSLSIALHKLLTTADGNARLETYRLPILISNGGEDCSYGK